MGRYARKDPEIARLLSGGDGWRALRDMRLYDAIQVFSAAPPGPGLVRTYQAFSDLYGAMDDLFLETEHLYLSRAPSGDRALVERRGWVALRRGDLAEARAVFGAEGSRPRSYPAALARAGIAFWQGDMDRVRVLARQAPPPQTETDKVLGLVACYLWGVPCPTGDRSPYGQALDAFRQGDLASGVLALEMIDFNRVGDGPGADLFLYELLQRGFGGLAANGAGQIPSPYWAGRGFEAQGRWDKAAASYVADRTDGSGPAPWLFSPVHGGQEAAELGRVRAGAALFRAGRRAEGLALWRKVAGGDPTPLTLAVLAGFQAELGLSEPLGDPVESARAAVRAVERLPERLPPGPESAAVAELYAVRRAEVARWAARALWARGLDSEALQVLDAAHQKGQGAHPDFRNPPAFLADLARAYARAGQFAPAVAILFDLTREYPSARLAYESMKRLYASRSGGGVPPR